ncbi:hypothetical protein BRAD285_4584 [Bradyrhizobium sp. ORS 285]|nr:hypothetical protein BRAD285_4584 [Bradyrhizobium sp. ORS 285]
MRDVRVVTTRWAGNAVDVRASARFTARTNDVLADVKSRGPDTPKPVSPAQCAQAHCRDTVANKPVHRGDRV